MKDKRKRGQKRSKPNRMRFIVIGIVLLLGLLLQVEARYGRTWYWAYREADGAIIAYHPSGANNILLEEARLFESWRGFELKRIDTRTAILVVDGNDGINLYFLTPTDALLVQEQSAIINPEVTVLMYPYILIWDHDNSPPLLFNRETLQTEILDLEAWDEMRVSADGRYIRYRVEEDTGDARAIHWRLMEYDVLERSQRTIFSRDVEFPREVQYFGENCTPDENGDKWFCVLSDDTFVDGLPLHTQSIIHADGRSESVASDQHLKVGLNGDWYFMSSEDYYGYCAADCVIEVTHYATGEARQFDFSQVTFSEDTTFNIFTSRVLDENRLLLRESQYYLLYLFEDGDSLTYLGTFQCCHIDMTSPDGRWQMAWDERTEIPRTVLYDLQSGHVVMWDYEVIDLLSFVDGGAYFWGTIFYSFESGVSFRVPPSDGLYPGLVIDILPSGVAVGYWDDSWGIPAGIYRTSEREGRVLLISDAAPILDGIIRLDRNAIFDDFGL